MLVVRRGVRHRPRVLPDLAGRNSACAGFAALAPLRAGSRSVLGPSRHEVDDYEEAKREARKTKGRAKDAGPSAKTGKSLPSLLNIQTYNADRQPISNLHRRAGSADEGAAPAKASTTCSSAAGAAEDVWDQQSGAKDGVSPIRTTAAPAESSNYVDGGSDQSSCSPRRNPVGVQLLSPSLHQQLFPGDPLPQPPSQLLDISKRHLQDNKLHIDGAAVLPEISFDMPQLQGANIREHFQAVGAEVAEPYLSMAKEFARTKLPEQPAQWEITKPGWTKYLADGSRVAVKDLGEETLVSFDVETLYKVSPYPVMATAATPNAWYSWLSPVLFDEPSSPIPVTLVSLFPPKSSRSALVIGHNVGYDRARVFEEYHIDRTPTRWLDTLSLHVATRGITSVQRPAWMKHNKSKQEKAEMRKRTAEVVMQAAEEEGDEELFHSAVNYVDSSEDGDSAKMWEDMTSTNSLAEVARLHCGQQVDKSIRNRFADESLKHPSELVPELTTLLQYCATDVQVTHDVYAKVLPLFLLSCQHPASFAGALAMGNAFLPVDEHWQQYIQSAEAKYQELHNGVHDALITLAEALRARGEDPEDPWSSQLDWSLKIPRWRDDAAAEPVQSSPSARRSSVPLAAVAAQKPASAMKQDELPRWLAEGARNAVAMMEKPIATNQLLAYLLRVTYRSYPVAHSAEHLWLFCAPRARAADLEATHGPPLKISSRLDPSLSAISGDHVFFKLVSGAKCRSLFTRRMEKLWKSGLLESSNSNLAERLVLGGEVNRETAMELVELAGNLEAEGPEGLHGRFLDWTPSARGGERTAPRRAASAPLLSKSPSSPPSDMWPAWYWDLTYTPGRAARAGISPRSLDITPRKSITPLLLRMQWLGYPLFKLKQHGWTFRVPKTETQKANFPIKQKSCPPAELEDRYRADEDGVYFKLPHPDGEHANVGNPLAKHFMKHAETGKLSTATPIGDNSDTAEATERAMSMNSLCSYWMSARERIMSQLVIYEDDARPMGFPGSRAVNGIILPQVITMGTVTRRAVEPTWLTASNAKKNRVGSELKAMVRAPPGYALVGADVDSEELWIASVMGDSQFGTHGATAIGWMTLEGTKSAGTDLHSKTASILKTSRDSAKVFNYSRIYGAGIKHAVQLLLQNDATMSEATATELAKNLYKATKGAKARRSVANTMWHGGSESYLFNMLESVAQSSTPMTPALGCGVTNALQKSFLPNGQFGSDYLPSRINWVVQSSGVDYLHLLIIAMEYLIKRYAINARYLISVHDEVRYLATEGDKLRTALALQIANAWTRALFCYNLGMDDLPQGVAFFSAVDVDHVLRKEVDMPCVTPSQPHAIPAGDSLDINALLALTDNGRALFQGHAEAPLPSAPLTPIAERPNILSRDHEKYLEAQASVEPLLAKAWLSKRPRQPSAKPSSFKATGGSMIDPGWSAEALNDFVASEVPGLM